jgi:hypothetical protein
MDEKKIAPILEPGVAKVHKKTFFEKVKEAFFAQGFKVAAESTTKDILVPAAKRLFVDSLFGVINGMVFGNPNASNGVRLNGSTWTWNGLTYAGQNINYSGISKTAAQPATPTVTWQEIEIQPNFAAGENFESARIKADMVLDSMKDQLDRFGKVSISELYELVGLPTQTTYYNYGWTNLKGAHYEFVNTGYVLKFPAPTLIK